jgi:hypothetical protein
VETARTRPAASVRARFAFSGLMATVVTLALPACQSEEAKEKAREVGEQAKEMAKEAGQEAKEAGAKAKEVAKEVGQEAKEAGAKVKEAGEHLADEAAEKGKEMWAERRGELSDNAKDILAQGAASSASSVEAFVHKGTQVAPVAIEVAKTLQDTVDSDVDIEPIVQNLDDKDAQAELDKRIADMPRVETIDGVDVGFKEVTQWDTTGRGQESAYLILWRRDARLFGLVYRSKNRINVDKLVEEAPRLVRLVNGQAG